MAPTFELIVFDWDGTLMDSIGTIVACTQRAMAEVDLEPASAEAIRDTVGLRLDMIMEQLLPEATDALRKRCLERYRHHWIHTFHQHLTLLPEARETVTTLAEAGFLLAVATGKSRVGLERDFRATGLGEHFVASRTVDEASSKPHPQMLLDLMEELGTRPGETLMVGDTSHDLLMARNAGTPSIAVLTGSHGRPQLEPHGPLACLGSAAELPGWLSSR
ncbi:MAG: HAD-IA family hydrolase [Acidobacteriota bacterium]